MIQFAAHSANFRDTSLSEASGTIARMGFSYIDLSTEQHFPVANLSKRKKIADLRDLLSLYHLEVSDLYLTLPDITSDAKRAIERFKGILPFVKLIEARGITLRLPDSDDESQIEPLSNSLQNLVSHARQADIAFSIEARVDTPIDTPLQIRTMLNRVGGLQLTLNLAHMTYRSVSNAEISNLLQKTRHIHLRQAKSYSLQTPFEDGDIVPGTVLSTLQDVSYKGFISMSFLPYSERHHIANVDPVRESIIMRDALRDAREPV